MNNKEKTGNYRVICAKYSDGDSSKWPVTHLKQAFDKDHVKFFYELDKNSLLFNSWMERLGQEVTEITKSKEKLVLEDMPDGYKIFVQGKFPNNSIPEPLPMNSHQSQNKGIGSTRTDVFVFGNPRGLKYRSKCEFVPHFLWLYFGKKGSCKCRKCEIVFTRKINPTSNGSYHHQQKSVINNVDHDIDKKTLTNFNGSEYRSGELVWISVTSSSIPIKLLKTNENCKNNENLSEIYWPGTIIEVVTTTDENKINSHVADSSSVSTDQAILYKIKLLTFNETYERPPSTISPWLSKDLDDLIKEYSNEIYFTKFLDAVKIAKNIQGSFVTGIIYDYIINSNNLDLIKDPIQKKRIVDSKGYPHYSEIWFGAEQIKVYDFVRLTSNNESDEKEYFRITSIYRLPNNIVQFAGDLYVLKKPGDDSNSNNGEIFRTLTIKDCNYISKNYIYEEYTIDLEDVAGRFYLNRNSITKSMNATQERSSREELFSEIATNIEGENTAKESTAQVKKSEEITSK
ncbi:2408_t:CDS:2 [Entrophospora sp. SA101]|nr:2408_t:CDS:2 [Entrophospora sp. SA101]